MARALSLYGVSGQQVQFMQNGYHDWCKGLIRILHKIGNSELSIEEFQSNNLITL